MNLLFKLLLCILTLGSFSYVYVDRLNAHTELKLQIPQLAREIEQLKQDTVQLGYDIECFKSPQNLLQLAKQPEYSHLKFPYSEDIVTVPSGFAKVHVEESRVENAPANARFQKWPIFLGIK